MKCYVILEQKMAIFSHIHTFFFSFVFVILLVLVSCQLIFRLFFKQLGWQQGSGLGCHQLTLHGVNWSTKNTILHCKIIQDNWCFTHFVIPKCSVFWLLWPLSCQSSNKMQSNPIFFGWAATMSTFNFCVYSWNISARKNECNCVSICHLSISHRHCIPFFFS